MIGVCDVWVVRCRSGERESVVWGPGPRARGARRRAAPRYNSHAAAGPAGRAAVIDSRRARRGGAGIRALFGRSRSAENRSRVHPGNVFRRPPPPRGTRTDPGRRGSQRPERAPVRRGRAEFYCPYELYTSVTRVRLRDYEAAARGTGTSRGPRRGAPGPPRTPEGAAGRRAQRYVGIVLSRPRRRVVGSHQSSVNEASPGVLLQSWCGTRSTGASAARTPLRSK